MRVAHSTAWLPSSKRNPCPICGRTKDGDCRISRDGQQVICHHPKDYRPGEVVNGWAFTANTKDGRGGHFTPDKPREGSSRSQEPEPFAFTLARLPEAGQQPPGSWPPRQELRYSDAQQVSVAYRGSGKAFFPQHLGADGQWVKGAGDAPWPLWQQQEAITHGRGRWIAEAEGEKCAEWFRAAGVVAISQPGHDHTTASIERRYRALKAAGVAGVAYLADNDAEGERKAARCAAAAAAAGLQLVTLAAGVVWPGLPEKGSIDDAPGSPTERAAVFEAAVGQAFRQRSAPITPPEPQGSREQRHRLKPDEVVELLPKRVGRLRLNLRSGEVETATGTLTANQIGRLYLDLSSRAETWPKEPTADAVTLLASRDAFDPVAEYLNSTGADPLPMEQWQRLDRHLLGIDDPIAAAFLPRYLVAAVARVFRPGCSVRQTPILIGPQWRGKTALGRILFGESHWVEGIGELSRDDLMKAHTAWGVELAELDGVTRRRDQEQLKAFLTETCDTYRAPYDRAPERHARRFVFWATSNGPPLRDGTGSTRFVAIALPDQMLPLEWTAEHRDAIWARAVEQYRAGVDWDACSEEERQAIKDRNNNHQQIDPWAEVVMPKLRNWAAVGDGHPITLQAVYAWVEIERKNQNNANGERLSALLASAGWVHERRPLDGKKLMGWWPPEVDGHTAGHTGHTGDTPGCVQSNPSQAKGFNPSGHTGHTETGKPKKSEEREAADSPVSGADARVHGGFSPSGVSGVSPEAKAVAAQGQRPDTPRCVHGVSGVSAGVSTPAADAPADSPITGLPVWADQLEALAVKHPKALPVQLANLLAGARIAEPSAARVKEVLELLKQREAEFWEEEAA